MRAKASQPKASADFRRRPALIKDADVEALASIFGDDKTTKQVVNAAKRQGKKRPAPSPEQEKLGAKKKRASGYEAPTEQDLEAALQLPAASTDEAAINSTVLVTNRAPVVLAFAVALLVHTMPAQPLSSRLSLAQAVVSMNSRSKAVSLGIEAGKSAEEEGWGVGQKGVRVLGREVRTLRRVGWRAPSAGGGGGPEEGEAGGEDVALWGLDLEALRKTSGEDVRDGTGVGLSFQLPIHTPQSARSYLLKSFDSKAAQTTGSSTKAGSTKSSSGAASTRMEKERNLGLLLGALDLLFGSWSPALSVEELDRKAWGWYVQTRPAVPDGASGWGARGELRLADILALRRQQP